MAKELKLSVEDRFSLNLGEYIKDCFIQDLENKEFSISDEITRVGDLYLNFWEIDITGSPIERQLWAEILFLIDGFQQVVPLSGPEDQYDYGTWVAPQYRIDKYTVDFLFQCNCGGRAERLVVECDGHEFHEKTKQQAAHDKKRDRHFVKNGYRVLRFTGSEIYNSPKECAEDIEAVLSEMMESLMKKKISEGNYGKD